MTRKILIVDDSVFMLRVVADIIKKEPAFELVGKAINGRQAVEMNIELKPDVILLDVEMPIMNGLEALSMIMKTRPTAVVMFSSLTVEGAEITLKAMELGACDFIPKPVGRSLDLSRDVIDEIVEKLSMARVQKPVTRSFLTRPASRLQPKSRGTNSFKKLIAIGTSTGGPRALQEVLIELKPNLQAPILIVQHMPKLFTKQFADRLNTLCSMQVKEAEQGEELLSGTAYIAPGDQHLRAVKSFGGYKIELAADGKVSGHMPSVDAMFESLLPIREIELLAIIMTGMGRDGAVSMKKLHDRGVKCICQDEASSVVYGMPKSAVELGAVDLVLPLNKIAGEINRFMEV